MPIAFLSAYCCDLIAQSISALTNIPLEFKQDRERKCPLVHLLMGEMKAERLVSANTHGVTIECCVRAITDSMYHGKLTLFLDNDGSEVAKGSVAAKVGNFGGFKTSCPVNLKTCGFETTKTTPAS